MIKLYGVSIHSLVHVHDCIHEYIKNKNISNIKMKVLDKIQLTSKIDVDRIKELLSNYNLLLIPSYICFTQYCNFLLDHKGIVIIFDNPTVLNELEPLKFLDVSKKENSYTFTFDSINKKELFSSFKLLRNSKIDHVDFKIEPLKVIPKMIDKITSGKFLNKFNKFTYSVTNHTNRSGFIKLILSYLFGDVPYKNYKSWVSKYVPIRGKGKKLYEDVQLFLDSKECVLLKKALQECKKDVNKNGKKIPIKYKTISKKYNIDTFELKYLNITYKKYKDYKRKNKDIKEVMKEVKQKNTDRKANKGV